MLRLAVTCLLLLQAELAQYIKADVLLVGGSYSSPAKQEFLDQLEAALKGTEVTYLGPANSAAMLADDFSSLQVRACLHSSSM